jgi:hypothetical protein
MMTALVVRGSRMVRFLLYPGNNDPDILLLYSPFVLSVSAHIV